MLTPGSNCWRIEPATRVSVIVDADDYFRVARDAMLNAKHRIMLIGWDFDARIRLGDVGQDDGPEQLGAFVSWLANRNPALDFYLLRWDLGAIKSLFRGTTAFTVLNWMRNKRIHTKLDATHPPGASHHQKIVIIDDCFAFCGGIDMTGDRWDTRAHADDDPERHQPNGKPYKPWHDATTALQGKAAGALAELGRDRWHRAGGKPIGPLDAATGYWPAMLPVHFHDAEVAIARSEPEMPGYPGVTEIEQLYIDQIAAAEHVIYAESQYFASRKIAEAIGKRVAEENGPEIVLINPEAAQGWLEPLAMDTARARLFEAIRRLDTHKRFRIYHPYTAAGEAIYVHAKILIADDRSLRVGSSNMNNRSLRLDTECDITIDACLPPNRACGDVVTTIRNDLLAEHLGVPIETIVATLEQTGSLIATIEALRGSGKTLRPYETPNLSEVETWLADNEVLDPEGPGEMFESTTKRGLFRNRRWRKPR
ncbi:phospholipase D-like domain-containing protein [Sphingomonas sp. RB3P16]|uniref:phospholipase D-like domain-containing protein n=1 Tax=Parasphingomonas frigoris TaxID=3096163 RepID=UPI002FC59249